MGSCNLWDAQSRLVADHQDRYGPPRVLWTARTTSGKVATAPYTVTVYTRRMGNNGLHAGGMHALEGGIIYQHFILRLRQPIINNAACHEGAAQWRRTEGKAKMQAMEESPRA